MLESGVRLLGVGQIAGFEILAQLSEELTDLARVAASSSPTVMVVRVPLRGLALGVLLNLRIFLLSSRQVAGLKILRQLSKLLGDGVGAPRGRSGTALRTKLLQRQKIRLRGGSIAGLQILTKLLELKLTLTKIIPEAEAVVIRESAA